MALVINELATNAIKHAFEGKAGHISIAVHENDRRDTLIIVDDDGFALPEADSAKDGRMRLGSVKRLPRRSTAC